MRFGMNQTGIVMPGNRVLLHAHLEQAEAVDDVLARQMHEHRTIDRQIQLVDRRDVVLRVRIACDRGRADCRRSPSLMSVRPKRAVRPGIVDVPRELLADDANDDRFALGRKRLRRASPTPESRRTTSSTHLDDGDGDFGALREILPFAPV